MWKLGISPIFPLVPKSQIQESCGSEGCQKAGTAVGSRDWWYWGGVGSAEMSPSRGGEKEDGGFYSNQLEWEINREEYLGSNFFACL